MLWNYGDAERLAHLMFSKHALHRMVDLRVEPNQLMEVIARPEQTWTQTQDGEDEIVYQRGDLAVVVGAKNRVVITVLLRTPRRWEKGQHYLDSLPTF